MAATPPPPLTDTCMTAGMVMLMMLLQALIVTITWMIMSPTSLTVIAMLHKSIDSVYCTEVWLVGLRLLCRFFNPLYNYIRWQ